MKKLLVLILVVGTTLYYYANKFGTDSRNGESVPTMSPTLTGCEVETDNDPSITGLKSFEGAISDVNFSSNEEAKLFESEIEGSVANGPNFAGHFTLAHWGCGTDCVGYAVIDVMTGKIINYEPVNENYHLRDGYSLNSRVFILDPVEIGMERKYFVTNENNGKMPNISLYCSELSTREMYTQVEK